MAQNNTQLLQLTISEGHKCRLTRLLCSGSPEADMQVVAGRGSQQTRGGSASEALKFAAACPPSQQWRQRSCGFESHFRKDWCLLFKGLLERHTSLPGAEVSLLHV